MHLFSKPGSMKTLFIVQGKTTAAYDKEAIAEYIKRIDRMMNFELVVLPDLKNTKRLSQEIQKKQEADLLRKVLQPGDYIVLLDEKGSEFSSVNFAKWMEKKMSTVNKRLVFIIGGPYGFSTDIYNLAAEKIALSKMTFSHQMIRVIFIEQLYRALSILNNSPYHHE